MPGNARFRSSAALVVCGHRANIISLHSTARLALHTLTYSKCIPVFYDALKTILARSHDLYRCDPSKQRGRAFGVDSLKIGRAARNLALFLARALPEHVDRSVNHCAIEGCLLVCKEPL